MTVNPDEQPTSDPKVPMPVGTDEKYTKDDEPAEVLPFAKSNDPRVISKDFSPRPVSSDLDTDSAEDSEDPKDSSAQESATPSN